MSKDIDDIPVKCCKSCLSLTGPNIEYIEGERVKVCPYCGSTEEATMTIDKWNEAFERKYEVGPYLKLRKGIKWDEIMRMSDKEQSFDRNTERMIRNQKNRR